MSIKPSINLRIIAVESVSIIGKIMGIAEKNNAPLYLHNGLTPSVCVHACVHGCVLERVHVCMCVCVCLYAFV